VKKNIDGSTINSISELGRSSSEHSSTKQTTCRELSLNIKACSSLLPACYILVPLTADVAYIDRTVFIQSCHTYLDDQRLCGGRVGQQISQTPTVTSEWRHRTEDPDRFRHVHWERRVTLPFRPTAIFWSHIEVGFICDTSVCPSVCHAHELQRSEATKINTLLTWQSIFLKNDRRPWFLVTSEGYNYVSSSVESQNKRGLHLKAFYGYFS
jgi:hypothetical protein